MAERGDPAVQIRDLHITRGGVSFLRGVDLFLKRGRFLGIVGPNGAERRLFCVFSSASRGSIEGLCVSSESPPGAAAR